MNRHNIVLAAGGTGGHLFPAEALAQELQERGHRLVLVTDRRGAGHSQALSNLETHTIRAGTLSGGMRQKFCGLMNIVAGVFQARALLPRLQPHVVVGFGGYPSLPTMLAAARLGAPAAIHEQNAVLGRVNRLLAHRVNAIAVGSTRTEALKTVLTDDIEQAMVDLTPMGRLGEVEDIASCAVYLASPAASYLTGDIIGVNGGLNALNMKMPRAFD